MAKIEARAHLNPSLCKNPKQSFPAGFPTKTNKIPKMPFATQLTGNIVQVIIIILTNIFLISKALSECLITAYTSFFLAHVHVQLPYGDWCDAAKLDL